MLESTFVRVWTLSEALSSSHTMLSSSLQVKYKLYLSFKYLLNILSKQPQEYVWSPNIKLSAPETPPPSGAR